MRFLLLVSFIVVALVLSKETYACDVNVSSPYIDMGKAYRDYLNPDLFPGRNFILRVGCDEKSKIKIAVIDIAGDNVGDSFKFGGDNHANLKLTSIQVDGVVVQSRIGFPGQDPRVIPEGQEYNISPLMEITPVINSDTLEGRNITLSFELSFPNNKDALRGRARTLSDTLLQTTIQFSVTTF